jgi:hypothetical protein
MAPDQLPLCALQCHARLGWHFGRLPELDSIPIGRARLPLNSWALEAIQKHFLATFELHDDETPWIGDVGPVARLLKTHFRHRLSEHRLRPADDNRDVSTKKPLAWLGLQWDGDDEVIPLAVLWNTQLGSSRDFGNPLLLLCTPNFSDKNNGDAAAPWFGSRVLYGSELCEPHRMRHHLYEALHDFVCHMEAVHHSCQILATKAAAALRKAADGQGLRRMLQRQDNEALALLVAPDALMLPEPPLHSCAFNPHLQVKVEGFLDHMAESEARRRRVASRWIPEDGNAGALRERVAFAVFCARRLPCLALPLWHVDRAADRDLEAGQWQLALPLSLDPPPAFTPHLGLILRLHTEGDRGGAYYVAVTALRLRDLRGKLRTLFPYATGCLHWLTGDAVRASEVVTGHPSDDLFY